MKIKWLGLFLVMPWLLSCNRFPSERLTNPNPDGAVPSSNAPWLLFDEELRTQGGAYLYPFIENQTLEVGHVGPASSGSKSILYQWNGGPVTDSCLGLQHDYAGFGLIITPTADELASAVGQNLSSAGYKRVTFKLRGTISDYTILRVEGPAPAVTGDECNNPLLLTSIDINPGDISSATWTTFELPASGEIPEADFIYVKRYISFTFIYSQPTGTTNPGSGGTIYVDEIRYEKD